MKLKKQDRLTQYKNMQVFLISYMFIFAFLVAIVVYNIGYHRGKTIEINIPDSDMVNKFCRSQGYENGWVSSLCGINEVQCHRGFYDIHEYKCIKWDKQE